MNSLGYCPHLPHRPSYHGSTVTPVRPVLCAKDVVR